MGYHSRLASLATPLIRPKLLIEAARIGARRYCRARDLGAALPGNAGGTPVQIIGRLRAAEWASEELRRSRSPGYRPAAHVQVLAALLAEAAQANASGSDSFRSAM